MVEGVEEGLIASAHDISEGVWRPLWLKCVLGRGEGTLGANINLDFVPEKSLRADQKLFSEQAVLSAK